MKINSEFFNLMSGILSRANKYQLIGTLILNSAARWFPGFYWRKSLNFTPEKHLFPFEMRDSFGIWGQLRFRTEGRMGRGRGILQLFSSSPPLGRQTALFLQSQTFEKHNNLEVDVLNPITSVNLEHHT